MVKCHSDQNYNYYQFVLVCNTTFRKLNFYLQIHIILALLFKSSLFKFQTYTRLLLTSSIDWELYNNGIEQLIFFGVALRKQKLLYFASLKLFWVLFPWSLLIYRCYAATEDKRKKWLIIFYLKPQSGVTLIFINRIKNQLQRSDIFLLKGGGLNWKHYKLCPKEIQFKVHLQNHERGRLFLHINTIITNFCPCTSQ